MNSLLCSDLCRRGNERLPKFQYYLRKAQETKGLLHKIYRFLYYRNARKNGIEIPVQTKIGYGLYIGHPYCITINPKALIGNNCNIHRGVLIGQENRGRRKGAPSIGNNVWIGINAVIVGNITIGDDVLISPNTYINCSVPSHSVVYGNPCVIKEKNRATETYINHEYNESK